ncbi:larval/pupal cuticle protein H1C isoform X1 [Drosophila santomea]|uniref:larval/pupal cuticle protein H1C isoform X1 n=1 Tax=Drosophila santomea TaxID=129105 RepID=UPI001954D42B|nr:larval/pupal cuticle protein H1C isoform X1 [Drosophila santomea]
MAFQYLITLCALVAYANAGLLASHVAIANPSVDAVASTQQNVVRSFAGTLSSYSKAVDTPYSSVRKSDTRIQNNVYTPAVKTTTYGAAPLYTQATPIVAKTLVHAPAPVVEKTVYAAAPAPVLAKTVYSAPAPVYAAPAPVVAKTVYSAPAPVLAKTVYSAPAPVYAAPAPVYAAPAPVVAKTVYSAPAPVLAKTTVYSAPAPVYAAAAPVVAKTVSYAAPLATTNVNHGPAATTYSHSAPALGVSSYGSSQTVHYSPAESVSHMSFDGFGTHWGF